MDEPSKPDINETTANPPAKTEPTPSGEPVRDTEPDSAPKLASESASDAASPGAAAPDAAAVESAPDVPVASDADAGPAPSAEPGPAARRRKIRKRIIISLVAIVAAVVIIGAIVVLAGKAFTAQESEVRSDWSVETGDLLRSDTDLGVNLYDAGIDAQLRVLRIVPAGSNAVGFSYYNADVQDRLARTIADLQTCGIPWSVDNPLAILNPFGTGANGLYLYFETDRYTSVSYTIEAEGCAPFTATARDVAVEAELDANDQGLVRTHSFQIIGLVPGTENHVTLTVTGPRGGTLQIASFSVNMPETDSGYPTHLESTEGASDQPLSNGLYALMRTNGYLGYGFFFDNDGVMRYEMVTEGFGLDRMLMDDNQAIVCTSTQAISRIDALGRITGIYRLGDYSLHHDINYGPDGTVIALAERTGRETVEDVVIEVDLVTGKVTELVDFSSLMEDYRTAYTHAILPTSTFFWQAGEWDWIHLNSIEYFEEGDAIIVSSRETSTVMKLANVHSSPTFDYFIGDVTFWQGTPYEHLSLAKVGDFTPQYGQHAVEYDGEGPTENSYYLLMYDNNYWANSTRDGYRPDLEGTDVGTDLYNGTCSYVYRYLVDEDARTFELVDSFAVPYSSIVSNAAHTPDSTNYVVNSGTSAVYGEYDEDGTLIKQFAYICQLQGYRVFKDTFEGFWFTSLD